jgi:polar amino acid transport system substrate-binding protein
MKTRFRMSVLHFRQALTSLWLISLCFSTGAFAHSAVARPVAAIAAPSLTEPALQSPLVKVGDGRMLAPDIARIVNRGELVIAMHNVDNAPFFSEKNGVLEGIDVDLGKMIGNELGVPVRFDRRARTFDNVAEVVAAGGADLGIGRLARTLKRGKIVHFSTAYMRLGHALLIHRVRFAEMAGGQPLPQVIRNFTGKISVISGSSWEEFGRRNFPKAQIVPYPTWKEAVKAAKKGEVVAAYRDELKVQGIVRDDPGLALTLRTVTFNDLESSLSMMVGVRDATLLSFVNEVIAQRTEKPTVSSILKSIK